MLRDVMTSQLVTCPPSAPVAEAARLMRDRGIGDVLLQDGNRLVGIVTDRDIVVRGAAEHPDLASLSLRDVCSGDLQTVDVDADVDDVIATMEQHALRRVPVMEDGHAVGIVSLGDLAASRDRASALGRISTAPPNA